MFKKLSRRCSSKITSYPLKISLLFSDQDEIEHEIKAHNKSREDFESEDEEEDDAADLEASIPMKKVHTQ